MFQKIFLTLVITTLLSLASFFWLFSHRQNSPDLQAILWPEPKPLQAFTLIDQHQQPFTLERLNGKWTFLFFGYTSCPDICPTTMTVLKTVYERLQQDLKETPTKIQVVFISVDPQRDTPKQLAEYVAFFNQEFIGVTGVETEINGLTRTLGAGYLKQPGGTAGDYQISHTSTIFLIDPQQRLYAGFSPPQVPETIVSQSLKLFRE
jgi:protein SCO1/2